MSFPMLAASLVVFILASVNARGQSSDASKGKDASMNNKSAKVELDHQDKVVNVTFDNELFTSFDGKSYEKPILYPIYAPGKIAMTRDWPMVENTVGESKDHPHHKSMWISHEISGVDFWTEASGTVNLQSIETKFEGQPENVFRATSSWVRKSDQQTLLTDQTTYWFGGDQKSRWIHCLVNYRATHGDIEFEDTKEGLFAIRTHPDLRLEANPEAGVKEVFGKAINSEGQTGKEVWGKPAKWMLYWGTIEGKPVSIAIYDHPTNLRHPTTWHAREYGLIAANPFGLHYFLDGKKGAGAHQVRNGGSLQLRYRIEFFDGIVKPEIVEEKFEAFSNDPLTDLEARKQ